MSRVLVTGASGFVGRAICARLAQDGYEIVPAVRTLEAIAPQWRDRAVATGELAYFDDWERKLVGIDAPHFVVGELGPETVWGRALEGVSVVVHLAARTHRLRERQGDALAAYRRVNVDATRRLAAAAAAAGVKRFVFLSSVKVNGEATSSKPFKEFDVPRPEDAYGITKLEAERELVRVAAGSGMSVTIIRPPLVYGPGVKGNFLALMRMVCKGMPLPLASIDNRRSFVYVGNLVSAIMACVGSDRAAGQTFLVSDGEDLSTPDLIRRLALALGVRPRLYPFPVSGLRFAGALLGQRDRVARLVDSLQVDSSKIKQELEWRPPSSVEQGLIETARWLVSRDEAR